MLGPCSPCCSNCCLPLHLATGLSVSVYANSYAVGQNGTLNPLINATRGYAYDGSLTGTHVLSQVSLDEENKSAVWRKTFANDEYIEAVLRCGQLVENPTEGQLPMSFSIGQKIAVATSMNAILSVQSVYASVTRYQTRVYANGINCSGFRYTDAPSNKNVSTISPTYFFNFIPDPTIPEFANPPWIVPVEFQEDPVVALNAAYITLP